MRQPERAPRPPEEITAGAPYHVASVLAFRALRAPLLALVAAGLFAPIQPATPALASAGAGPSRPADVRQQATVTRGPVSPGRAAYLPIRRGPSRRAGRQPAAPAQVATPLAPVGQSAAGAGLGANGSSPSDSTGAIGTNHYIEFVNTAVGLYDRSLAQISSVNLATFIGAASAATGDVQVQWDEQAQRWVYSSLELYGCGTSTCSDNRLAFGWSKGADVSGLTLANTDWCNFHLDTGTSLYDFPKLGHDVNFLTIGANVFDANANFTTAAVVAVPMPASGDTSCTAPAASIFGSKVRPLVHVAPIAGQPVFTPVPANTTDASSTGYISAADSSGSYIGEWHVVPTGGACVSGPCLVSDGEIAIPTWAGSGSGDFTVPQPGGHQPVDALDGRLTQAVQHADPSAGGAEAVWTQHTTGSLSGRSVVTWFELLPGTCAAGTCTGTALHQQGTLSNASLYLFNAAISPTSHGDGAVVQYNTGSAATFIDVRAQSRNAADPLGAMSGELVLRGSTVADSDGTCVSPYGPPCRWGDYPGASPDPADCSTVWGTSMLSGTVASAGPPTWVTQNFALSESALHTAVSTQQYALAGGDGATWTEIDSSRLVAGAAPCVDSTAIVSANADLFTSTRGVNQDLGIFVDTDGVPSPSPVAWKESGGFGGTFSPNAAYVHAVVAMPASHTYVVRLKWKTNIATAGSIYAGAGPLPGGGGFSPTRLSIHLFSSAPQSVAITSQEHLSGSDGVTWTPVPSMSPLTLAPAADSRAVIGANADLFTDTAGFNQDLGIQVSGGAFGSAGQVVAWKESGGFAGTFSPNAAFAQAVVDLTGGITYTAQLVWKSNRPSPSGASIYAGAGPFPALSSTYSPTSLVAYLLAGGANPQGATLLAPQPANAGSNGSSWVALGGVHTAAIAPAISTYAIVSANADLFTNTAGFNQDLAIFVSVDGGAGQLVAWKESGGYAGTFSPNAAFVQSAYPMVGGHSYVFSLRWKTNRPAPGGATIYAGAGPVAGSYSPTSIEVESLH